MMRSIGVFLLVSILGSAVLAQTKTKPPPPVKSAIPKAVPVKEPVDAGTVSGRTYMNRTFGFEVTFPNSWLIPGDDFEAEMKRAGFDLGLKAPANVGPQTRTKINQAIKKVEILLTAYRSIPGSADNAIVRISVEDLSSNPQIKDAVDYFDAMRSQFKTMTLPADFKYSETQAEQLGRKQFGFLDSSNNAGKKRLYATVRKGYAILFSLSYSKAEDLQTLREVLAEGNFALK
ncbi:MAG: hypothetical protein HOP17_06070 [Acidobacteria bacterium]|nr:hypothetical protein [Acidobacteriota bacterium]